MWAVTLVHAEFNFVINSQDIAWGRGERVGAAIGSADLSTRRVGEFGIRLVPAKPRLSLRILKEKDQQRSQFIVRAASAKDSLYVSGCFVGAQ
jgi:hypothetical protein